MLMTFQKKMKYILIFCFPILLVNVVFLLLKIILAGRGSLWYVDLPLQIVYFYKHLLNTLSGTGNLFYSINYGMGESFWATFTYYLSSPLSLLVYPFKFLPENWVIYAPLVIWMIKLGLSGVTMLLLLQKKCTNNVQIAFVFAAMYSLTGFALMYYFLPMWIDAVYLLPLLVLGIYAILDHNKNTLFLGCLTYLFFANFYTAYMAGIFLFLFFITELYIFKLSRKEMIQKILLFFKAVFWAASFTVFIYLPTYFIIRENTYSAKESILATLFQFHFGDVYRAFYNSAADVQSLTLYCTVFAFLLIPLFFVLKTIDKREKIGYGLLLFILLLSVANPFLSYIWQTFEIPNGAPFRFVFVLSFYMIFLSCKTFSELNKQQKFPKKPIFWIGFINLVLVFLFFSEPKRLVINLFFVLVFTCILLSFKAENKKWLSLVLLLFILGDLGSNSFMLFFRYSRSPGSISSSFYSQDNPSYERLLRYIKKQDTSFYRIHVDTRLHLQANESLKYQFKNLNMYSSTSNFQVNSFLSYLGYSAKPRYTEINRGHMLADTLFNFKYFITKYKMDSRIYEFVKEDGNLKVYKYKSAMPFGYPVTPEMMQMNQAALTFDRQNLLLNAEEKYYHYISENEMTFNEQEIGGRYANRPAISDEAAILLNYHYQVRELSEVYLQLAYETISSLRIDDIQIMVNGKKIVPTQNQSAFNAIYLGTFNHESVDVQVSIPSPFYAARPHLIQLDFAALNHQLAPLRQNGMMNYQETPTKISGTVQADNDLDYLVSIPYDKNWQILVDGKKTPITQRGIFMAFPLTAGQHEIILKYRPKLIYYCFIFSIGSFLCYLGCVRRKKRTKKILSC